MESGRDEMIGGDIANGSTGQLASVSPSMGAVESPSNIMYKSWGAMSTGSGRGSMAVATRVASTMDDSNSINPNYSGVGLYFERDSQQRPVIKEIHARGSAHRDGTLDTGDIITHVDGQPCTTWPLAQIKKEIVGVPGSVVRLTASKASGRILDVSLVRGNPEYWQYHDMTQKLRKDLSQRDQEIDALKKKLRDAENTIVRDRTEIESANSQVSSLERLNTKVQMDLEREIDLRRRSENMLNGLNAEKKHLEEQIETLLKKVSEVTLSFKSGQSLAREMTEKARQSEQARANEEKLRKLAEARETRAQSLLLEEIQRRKDAESEKAVTQARISELEAKIKLTDDQQKTIAKLQGEVYELQGKHTIALTDSDTSKLFVEKLQDENRQLRSKGGELESSLQATKKEMQSVQDKLRIAEQALQASEQAKEQALGRETEASKSNVTNETAKRSLEISLRESEATINSMKTEIAQLQDRIVDKTASEKRLQLDLERVDVQLAKMKEKNEELAKKRTQESQEAEAKIKSVRDELAASKENVSSMENQYRKVNQDLVAAQLDASNKISALQNSETLMKDKIAQLETDLARTLEEASKVKSHAKQTEQSLAAAEGKYETAHGETRVLKSELAAILATKASLEDTVAGQFNEIAALKSDSLKIQQEKESVDLACQSLAERCADLNRNILDLQHNLRSKTADVEGLEAKVSDQDSIIAEIPGLRKLKITQTSKIRELDDLIAALKAENQRITENELKTRGELNAALKKHEILLQENNDQKVELTNEIKAMERELREEMFMVTNERDNLQAELDRYYSLPNPTGVGMGLEETIEKLPTGGSVKTLKVAGLTPGMSADLSGVILPGDDVLEVDGVNTVQLTLEDLRNKIAGKRGTKVSFKMLRETDEAAGVMQGKEYMIVLKRGAWGPEHSVISPEVRTLAAQHTYMQTLLTLTTEPQDRDMLDVGRWPKRGALSGNNFSLKAIDGLNISRGGSASKPNV